MTNHCTCPGDCNCHSQFAPFFRPTFCGCRGHKMGNAGRMIYLTTDEVQGTLTPGTLVDILPDADGTNFGNPKGWTVVGPTRHPYAMVVREPDHGTTVHVMVDRLVVA